MGQKQSSSRISAEDGKWIRALLDSAVWYAVGLNPETMRARSPETRIIEIDGKFRPAIWGIHNGREYMSYKNASGQEVIQEINQV